MINNFDLVVTRNESHKIPCKSGIYVLLSDKNDILYVGQSKSLRYRLKEHLRSSHHRELGEISNFIYRIGIYYVDKCDLDEQEFVKINESKPLFNKEMVDYVVDISSICFNTHSEIEISRCKKVKNDGSSCKKSAYPNGYCHIHDPDKHNFSRITEDKLLKTEMQRLLSQELKHVIKKGMYFYMSKETLSLLIKESPDMDIYISSDNIKFRNHKIIIDDIDKIRLYRYPLQSEKTQSN